MPGGGTTPFRPPPNSLICEVLFTRGAWRDRRRRAVSGMHMKLLIERAALLKALGHVQSVVERRNTIPILSNVLLTAGKDGLSFSATDLDMEIIDETSAHVETPGQITAPAHTLYEIVRKLPEGAEISLGFNGEDPRLQVRAGRYKVNLPVLPAGDFPNMSAEGLSAPVGVDTVGLMRLIDRTRFAISTEETRYYLTGIYLHTLVEDGREILRAVATDGHRLALAETDQKLSGLNGEVRVLIPKKAMDEVEKLSSAAGAEAHLEFAKDESHLFFQVEHRLLISRILTGQFPNYEAVLPRENNKTVVLERTELSDAVRRVSQLADQRSHAVKLAVTPEGVEISASSPEYGEAKETIEKEYKGEPLAIGFNAQYMIDFLAAAPEGPISLELKDEQSAGQMRPLADEAYRYRYVIMPMRI